MNASGNFWIMASILVVPLAACADTPSPAGSFPIGQSATLDVGPTLPFTLPSAAIAKAKTGDTIRIAPGTYADCAVVRQNGLTIQGTGPGVILGDKSCAGKAILVISGDNVTVRDLTLQHARVPDRNGAGIRAEGGNLTVERVNFLDNENGILSANNPRAAIRVSDSTFTGNGVCAPACAHGIYIGEFGSLRVERSRFRDTRQGHHIKSRAHRTEVIDCDIADGPEGNSSYLIDIPNGGSVLVAGNRLEKGPRSDNPGYAIMIGAEGVTRPTPDLVFRNNVLVNDTGRMTVFVENRTGTNADLIGNRFTGAVTPLTGPGTSR